MNERMCYCRPRHDRPTQARRRIPPGFCGICRECAQPGHTRHSPIPAPFTGAWCDRCYEELGIAYDEWRVLHPEGYTTEFVQEWEQTRANSRPHERPRGIRGFLERLLGR